MVDIRHRIGVKDVAPDRVYEALTTVPGLAGWWTEDTSGRADPGGLLAFRFPPVGGFDILMSLKALLETGTGAPAPHDVEISDWH